MIIQKRLMLQGIKVDHNVQAENAKDYEDVMKEENSEGQEDVVEIVNIEDDRSDNEF